MDPKEQKILLAYHSWEGCLPQGSRRRLLKKKEKILSEWGFIVGERDWAQLKIQHGQMGIHSQRAEWRSVDENLLMGNIKGDGDSG